MINQTFDLRFVTRRNGQEELLCEFDPATVTYRVLGLPNSRFGILDVAEERKATVECPCPTCAQRRSADLRLHIAAQAVMSNPASPAVVTDGVEIRNAERAKSAGAAADHILTALLSRLRHLTKEVETLMAANNITPAHSEGHHPQ